ncbi:MAG: hypothetical protein MRECE_20c014 [Mycoplasmataceae bacterium CE_OT135]|nr:MAG: hypothetical protein MRECE_20c014 [Mycoplasmataceae bacterium CE_OT135]
MVYQRRKIRQKNPTKFLKSSFHTHKIRNLLFSWQHNLKGAGK